MPFKVGSTGNITGVIEIYGITSGVGVITVTSTGLLLNHMAVNKNVGYDLGVGAGSVRISGINDAGNTNIPLEIQGTTLVFNSTTGATSIQFKQYGAGTLTTDASGNITAVSDERLKSIKGRFRAGLKEVLSLRPIRYKWNRKSLMDRRHEYAGFSAQDVQKAIPIAVGQNPDGTLTLQDRALMAALVNAVQELSAKVDRLEKRK